MTVSDDAKRYRDQTNAISENEHRFIMTDGASETTECPNSWLGSHKFEPRYDLSAADLSFFLHAREFKLGNDTVEKLRTKTYVRDVCVKCGKIIER